MEENNLPQNLDEFCNYIIKYADDIYVREQKQIDGKWDSYALTELPVKKALEHVMRFIKEGRIPHRIIRAKSSDEDKMRGKNKT